MTDQVLVQEWQPFFMTLAGASAALAGLVFVAMSLHPQPILSNPLMRARAFAAAFGFLIGVAWAFIMLLPARTAPLGSLLLIAVGVGGIIFVAYQQFRIRKTGMNVTRPVLSDILVPAPVAAGIVGLLQPDSVFPFLLLAIAAGVGLFVLFSQSWSLQQNAESWGWQTVSRYGWLCPCVQLACPTFCRFALVLHSISYADASQPQKSRSAHHPRHPGRMTQSESIHAWRRVRR